MDWKEKQTQAIWKRKITVALVGFLVLLGFVISYFPHGISDPWKKIYQFFGLSNFSSVADDALMSMHVLNVGRADAILLESGNAYVLVDGGTSGSGETVCRYLRQRGVQKLDLVVNTHPDEDHIGGLATVLKDFSVDRFFCSEPVESWQDGTTAEIA